MKFFNLTLVLCILAVLPLAAGGIQPGTQSAGNSSTIINQPGQLPLVREPLALSLGIQQNLNVSNYNETFLTKYLEQKTGIKINFSLFAGGTDSNTQFELMVSSNEKLPDILFISPPNWMDHGSNGVFLDLNPYFRDYAYFYNERIREAGQDVENYMKLQSTALDGKRYAWIGVFEPGGNRFGGKDFINTTWLNNLGMKMPATTDEFYNTLVAFRDKDPNKNNQKDEIPWLASTNVTGANPLYFLMNAFLYHPFAGQNEAFLNATNGKLWTPWTTEEYREALRYISRLFSEGLLSPTAFTITQPEMISILSYQKGETNRVGVFSGNHTLNLLPETPAIYDYAYLISLTGPKGVNFYPQHPPISLAGRAFITKDCKYPEAAFRWLDFLYDKEASMTVRYGEKDLDWKWLPSGTELTTVVGLPALYDEVNVLWGLPQNKHWQIQTGTMILFSTQGILTDGRAVPSVGWNGDRWKISRDFILNAGKDVPEKVTFINYSKTEDDSIREIRNSINTYRNESLAMFCTGQMSLDRDWNAYLQTLERIGLQRYLQVAQTAYTRTVGK